MLLSLFQTRLFPSMFFGPSPVPDGISITPAGALEDVHLPRWIGSKVHRMVIELVPDLRKCGGEQNTKKFSGYSCC